MRAIKLLKFFMCATLICLAVGIAITGVEDLLDEERSIGKRILLTGMAGILIGLILSLCYFVVYAEKYIKKDE